jgi:hypothetical protein
MSALVDAVDHVGGVGCGIDSLIEGLGCSVSVHDCNDFLPDGRLFF